MSDHWAGRRVFVSGGAGVIGTELVLALLEQGARVLCADLKARPAVFQHDALEYVEGDANYLSRERLEAFGPDTVFHLAATFERSIETLEFWEENYWHNIRLSHHLMSIAREIRGLKRVVFASSYLVYDPDQYLHANPPAERNELPESARLSPRNICGAAKLLHEEEVKFLEGFDDYDFTTASARIYRVYGKNSRDVVSRWIRALVADPTAQLSVFGTEAVFDYVYAGDVATGLLRLAESDATGAVNIGSGQGRSVDELIEILRAHAPDLRTVREKMSIPYEASVADIARLGEVTGWEPPTSLEDGVRILWDHETAARGAPAGEAGVPRASVLITSASRKVPLVRRFVDAMRAVGGSGAVWGGDCDDEAIARHFADAFWCMPRLDSLSPDALVSWCRDNGVTLVVPTRDGELAYFATHRQQLADAGIDTLIAGPETVDLCLDKLAFAQHCAKHDLRAIPTHAAVADMDAGEGRIVVKDRYGAGTRSLFVADTREEAEALGSRLPHPIFQPFVAGDEYSVDVFVNKAGQLVEAVPRTRERVHAGESVITETVDAPELVEMTGQLCTALGLTGPAVFQAFADADGFTFIECNPRLGGATSVSIEAGLRTPTWSLLEAAGQSVAPRLGQYRRGVRGIRYTNETFLQQ